jgi:hypothetical protein
MRGLIVVVITVLASANTLPCLAFTYAGNGTQSCGAWTADRRQPYGTSAQQWVLGYLAGAAEWSSDHIDPLSGTDAAGVWAWLDRYCWDNPTDLLVDAMVSFTATRTVLNRLKR